MADTLMADEPFDVIDVSALPPPSEYEFGAKDDGLPEDDGIIHINPFATTVAPSPYALMPTYHGSTNTGPK